MKIAVLAGEVLRRETEAKPMQADIEITWLQDLHELQNITGTDAFFDLEFKAGAARIEMLRNFSGGPVFINAVTHSLAETDYRFIRINAWPTFWQRSICEAAVSGESQEKEAVKIFDALKWEYRFVPDVPGFITPRVVAAIINEAYYTLDAGVSVKAEIDTAMKLGTNYPFGPFEWSEMIGLEKIHALLSALSKTSDRYLVSEGLTKELMEKQVLND